MDHTHGGTFMNFMVLKPKEASLSDLFHLMRTGDISANKAVDCPDGSDKIHGFLRRRAIVFSLFMQMVLHKVRSPMATLGEKIENWMNCYYMSGSSFKARLAYIFKPKENKQCPDKESSNFRSFLGMLDKRIDLDAGIKPDDGKYHAHISMMAAKIAYENENAVHDIVTDNWKMYVWKYFNCVNDFESGTTTQAFMFSDKQVDANLVVVSFRGTEPFNALQWSTDIDFSWHEISDKGKIHGGFMKALGLQKSDGWPKELKTDNKNSYAYAYYDIREQLKEVLKQNKNAKFLVTGHSLGGALAVLFPCILEYHKEDALLERLEGVYTFGQPRVGNAAFAEFARGFLDTPKKKYSRFVYGNDIIPRVPFDDKTLSFKHIGDCLYYNSFYKGKVLTEQPNKNYFSLLALVPKHSMAIYEFFRSFVIGYVKGPDYTEGWLLRFARFLALIFPGLTPHGPQDYVNCTRLGELVASADISVNI